MALISFFRLPAEAIVSSRLYCISPCGLLKVSTSCPVANVGVFIVPATADPEITKVLLNLKKICPEAGLLAFPWDCNWEDLKV
jgi:hypothetical protein